MPLTLPTAKALLPIIAARLCTSDRAIRKKKFAAVVTTVTQHYHRHSPSLSRTTRAAASREHSRSVPIARLQLDSPSLSQPERHHRRLPFACPAPHPRSNQQHRTDLHESPTARHAHTQMQSVRVVDIPFSVGNLSKNQYEALTLFNII